MKTSKTITSIAAAILTLASALAETDVIPLPRPLLKATPKPEKVYDIKEAVAWATYAPRPQYPYAARSKHVTGSGVVVARVNPDTGHVTSVKLVRSTGSPILDYAALSAFGQWRFRPKTARAVRIPIVFSMTGAQY